MTPAEEAELARRRPDIAAKRRDYERWAKREAFWTPFWTLLIFAFGWDLIVWTQTAFADRIMDILVAGEVSAPAAPHSGDFRASDRTPGS